MPLDSRPNYGSPLEISQDTNATASDWKEFFTVEGKGFIYGGWVYIDDILDAKLDRINLQIDGTLDFEVTLEMLEFVDLTQPLASPIYKIKFDLVNWNYTLGIMPGLSFERSFMLRFGELHTRTPRIIGHITYALQTEP